MVCTHFTRLKWCVHNPKAATVSKPIKLCHSFVILNRFNPRSESIRLDSNRLESVSECAPLTSAVERHKCLSLLFCGMSALRVKRQLLTQQETRKWKVRLYLMSLVSKTRFLHPRIQSRSSGPVNVGALK